MLFRPSNETSTADMKKAMQLLGLDPDAREFRVVSGSLAANDREIAMLWPFNAADFFCLCIFIDVPESHVSQGRVIGTEKQEC